MNIDAKDLMDYGMRCGRPMKLLVALCLFVLSMGCAHSWQPPPTIPDRIPVLFRYEHPEATAVSIVADFAQWEPKPMVRRGETWTFEASLSPGRYLYAFLVDGRIWQPDPWAVLLDDDGFGKKNSVLLVE